MLLQALCIISQAFSQWITTRVTVQKHPIWVKICNFWSRVTLKFDRWPWKTIGHLFCATLSFVCHFLANGRFKLELQPRNAQFGSKSAIFHPMWPWNLMDDLENNNRAPLVCYFKLCASFNKPRWNKTRVTVRKLPLTLKYDGWPWKTIGHLF